MLIAQISDTHILEPRDEHPAGRLRAECLTRCVADINRQEPDAVVLTGDTVQHGSPEEYERLRELLAPLEAPLYLVPGNRDDNSALAAAFSDLDYLPTDSECLHYEIDEFECRLVAIDSTAEGERKGVFGPSRQERLDAVLSAAPDRPTLLFIHHPPFDVGDHYTNGYRRTPEAQALADIVSRHPQAIALLCGHVHCQVERDWAGTRAIVMPSVAIDVRKGIDENEAQGTPIYLLHSVTNGGRLSTQQARAA